MFNRMFLNITAERRHRILCQIINKRMTSYLNGNDEFRIFFLFQQFCFLVLILNYLQLSYVCKKNKSQFFMFIKRSGGFYCFF